MSQADTRDPFGRLGPLLMSYVRHVVAFPQPLAAWSEHQGSSLQRPLPFILRYKQPDIMFYGPSGNRSFTSNFIHQAAHALDLGVGNFSSKLLSNNIAKGHQLIRDSFSFSAGTQWTNAVDTDSCVVDKV